MKKEKLLKGFKRIKWENIITILYLLLIIYQLCYHIKLNGFTSNITIEIAIQCMFLYVIHYVIKSIRKGN